MIRLMVAAAALLLAASQARAEPPDYTWIAHPTLVSGSPRNCLDRTIGTTGYPPYKMELRGNSLTGTILQGETSAWLYNIELDLTGLNQDGSGQVKRVQKDKNWEFLYTFAPGKGPRSFTSRRTAKECVFEWVVGR
jgi:hypothetical protein